METFADYILSEKNWGRKLEILYYLQKKTGIFYDNSVIFKTLLAKLFLDYAKLDVNDNEVITACLLCNCKKNNLPGDLSRIKLYAKEGAEYLSELGFSDRFCRICEGVNRYTINENRDFDDFSLQVDKGDFVTIIGSNGAGKSTLLNIIAGSIAEDSGRIIINNEEVSNKAEYKRAKSIGRVFQNPSVGVSPNMTILENMSLADNKGKRFGLSSGINKKKIDEYKEMLKRVDLGLEDKLFNKVQLLSGGQRQALTLMMAVMSNPKLLLLDEHTAALDPKTSEKIMDITKKIVKEKGITTLMVTHNLKHAVETGNRLFMMHRGVVVIDVKGKEKAELDTTDKLMALFEKLNVRDDLSDKTLLG